MAVTVGVLALLEAKPEKGADLAALLESARAIAAAEQGTVTWYAFKLEDSTYGIFDTFESKDAREAHLAGEIPRPLPRLAPTCSPGTPRSTWPTAIFSVSLIPTSAPQSGASSSSHARGWKSGRASISSGGPDRRTAGSPARYWIGDRRGSLARSSGHDLPRASRGSQRPSEERARAGHA